MQNGHLFTMENVIDWSYVLILHEFLYIAFIYTDIHVHMMSC
jgi:uncharacterized membrane protein